MPEEIRRDHAKMLRILGNVMKEILQVAAHPMEKHERGAVAYFKDPNAIPALEESCFATEQLYPMTSTSTSFGPGGLNPPAS
jgi:hypothetical protein